MKAIIYTKYGPPDVLELKEVEKPTPKANELLIKVRATTVNRTDCANLKAKPFIMRIMLGLFKPKNQIMGTEFAGDIEEVGGEVTSFKAGDKVFGFEDGVISSYAEYMVIADDKAVAMMPEEMSYEQAAACIEGFHYAYNLINKTKLKSGDKALVNGAAGGIGSATTQLLNYFGAEITAVCKTKDIELVKSLGAGKVIDYTTDDFTKDADQYDYVFDSVGKSTFGLSKYIMKPGATYISSELGPNGENILFSLTTGMLGSLPGQNGKKVKFPYPPDIMRSILLLKKLIAEGKYKSVIDRSYPLEEIADAFRYVETGEKTGNVVINVAK